MQVLSPGKDRARPGKDTGGLDLRVLGGGRDVIHRGKERPGASGEGGDRLGHFEFRVVPTGRGGRGQGRGERGGGRHDGGRQEEEEAKEGATANLGERRGGSRLGKSGAQGGRA